MNVKVTELSNGFFSNGESLLNYELRKLEEDGWEVVNVQFVQGVKSNKITVIILYR